MNKKKKLLILFSALAVLAGMAASFAWLMLGSDKLVDVSPIPVEKPPTISVLNNETTTADILNLDGLQVGRQKCIVFCVTPSSAGLVNKFMLQLTYTTNLKETVDIYPCVYVTEKPSTGADAESAANPQAGDYIAYQSREDSSQYYYYQLTGGAITPSKTTIGDGYSSAELSSAVTQANRGVYQIYKDTASTTLFQFNTEAPWTDSWNNNTGRYVFYMILVHWNVSEGELANLSAKETDMIYVSARGIIE